MSTEISLNWYFTDRPTIPEVKYEYLDHTADVQIHSCGETVNEAFEQAAVAMFNYMTTDYDTVDMKASVEVSAEGHDEMSLFYNFLQEWLYCFSVEPFFIPRVIEIIEMDYENFSIRSKGWGEPFDSKRHPPGTEVKAITYSNMQIKQTDGQWNIFVIIDI